MLPFFLWKLWSCDVRVGERAGSGAERLAWAREGLVAVGEVAAFEAAFCPFSFPWFLYCVLLRD